MANELNDTGVNIVPKNRMNFSWRPSGSVMPSAQELQQRFLGSQPVNVTPVVDPNSATSGMDALSSLYTSPAKEEELRKASVQRRRILAVADALRHIGNIYQTTRYAPSQKFSSPVVEEESRYRQDKALRDAANVRFMSYQQAKAAQDAKMKQLEMTNLYNYSKLELEQEKLRLQRELNASKKAADDARVREIEARINRINELLPGEKAIQDASVKQKNASASASNASAAYNTARTNEPERFRTNSRDYTTYFESEPEQYNAYGQLIKHGNRTTRRVYGNSSGTMPGVNSNTMPGVKR